MDDPHGLMVHGEAVKQTRDVNQFAGQIDKGNPNLNQPCKVAVADAGYADTVELKKIEEQGIKVGVPSQRQALHQEEKPFSKSSFRYHAQQDCYLCPEGKELHYVVPDRKPQRQPEHCGEVAGLRGCCRYEDWGEVSLERQFYTDVRGQRRKFPMNLRTQYLAIRGDKNLLYPAGNTVHG